MTASPVFLWDDSITALMEDKPRANIKDLIVDPETFITDISDDKVRQLKMELDVLMLEFERENTIMYLASNYSNNKHLSMTALRAMHDAEIIELMDRTIVTLKAEMDRRGLRY